MIIENGILKFTDDKPKWWNPGVAIQFRKHKSTPGAWFLFKKLGEDKSGPTIAQDGTLALNDIPDGIYSVMRHSTTSVVIVPDAEQTQQQIKDKAKQSTQMPTAPNFETCTDIEFDLYILNTGKALQRQGRFSAGFSGWANTMSERFARFKMNKQTNTKKLGETAVDFDYYDQMMKVISDDSVPVAVKIRAMKELQAAKPKTKVKREIKRIVVPD